MSKKIQSSAICRLKRLNARIPPLLEREDASIAKRLRKPRVSPMEGIGILYEFLDKNLNYTNGISPCKKGCAFCCHSEVAISKLEADYIAIKTGRHAENLPNRPMTSETYCDPMRPCPFLTPIDNCCSIYAYRPVMCRTHVSLEASNEPCRFDSKETPISLLDRASSWPGAMQAYIELAKRYGESWADIRDYYRK